MKIPKPPEVSAAVSFLNEAPLSLTHKETLERLQTASVLLQGLVDLWTRLERRPKLDVRGDRNYGVRIVNFISYGTRARAHPNDLSGIYIRITEGTYV